jgi:hypothetical protein
MAGTTTVDTIHDLLAGLGVGQTLRLASAAGGRAVEVHARGDGSVEVPGRVLGRRGVAILTRLELADLAAHVAQAVGALDVGRSRLVDGAGVERALDGSWPDLEIDIDGILDRTDMPLGEQVRRFLAHQYALSYTALRPGRDGSLALEVDGRPVLLLVDEESHRIVVIAPLLVDVPDTAELHRDLSRITGHGLGRLRHDDGLVVIEVTLVALPFIGQHLEDALYDVAGDSDPVVDVLQASFGGRRPIRPARRRPVIRLDHGPGNDRDDHHDEGRDDR